jgi:asparagine synthase (glutamine-hydrolysing)
MCGISGIIRKSGRPVVAEEIQAINNLASHRGPDAEGYFLDHNLAMGHRRLAILDLTSAGNQPMTWHDRYTIVYNGEVYNYVELKDELSALDYRFTTGTDTEVILAAYDKWGPSCVSRFNGMWSFALYDHSQKHVFCSRDRFGIKPFYYADNGEDFVFCSEIKQVLASFDRNVVNLPVLLDYLVLGLSEHSSETFFANVHSLPGGCNLVYDMSTHRFVISRYYELLPDQALRNADEVTAIAEYRQLLEDSVRLRLRSDVRVGVCLSGGLDSSSIASIAASRNSAEFAPPISAITAASTNPENDESAFAELVAKKSGLDLNLCTPTTEDFVSSIEDVVRVQEEPFSGPSLVMQYYVFKKARELNCKVMLDGQGGDETLLGYERYYPSYVCSLSPASAVVGLLRSAHNSGLSTWKTLSYMLYFLSAGARKRYLRRRNRFLKEKYLDGVSWAWLTELSKAHGDIVQLQKLEISRTQLPHLLRYEDRNSMAHSIESRLPFLDYRLVEMAISLPGNLKIRDGWTKYVLRRSTENVLPSEVSWRKVKFGFEAPANKWLSEHRHEMQRAIDNSALIEEIATNTSGLGATSTWALYLIALWESVYDVHIS